MGTAKNTVNTPVNQTWNHSPSLKKSLKMNNKGLTLIELMVAMLISVIVISMVGMFISVGSKNYKFASKEIKLQMISQTVTNQLDDIIIESYWMEQKILSTDITAYIIYSGSDITVIFFDKTAHSLYIKDGFTKSQIGTLNTSDFNVSDNIMSSYVSDFLLTQNQTENEIQLKINMVNDTSSYTSAHTIALRNKMHEPE